MNTEPTTLDDEPAQPIVQWYPRGGPLRAVSPDVVAVGGLALGVLVTAAVAFGVFAVARRAFGAGKLAQLEVDRLVVRDLKVRDR